MCDTQLVVLFCFTKSSDNVNPRPGVEGGSKRLSTWPLPHGEVPPPPAQLWHTCPSTGTACTPVLPQISGFSGSPASLAHLNQRAAHEQALKQSVECISLLGDFQVYLLNKVHPSLEWVSVPTAPRLGWGKGEEVCVSIAQGSESCSSLLFWQHLPVAAQLQERWFWTRVS